MERWLLLTGAEAHAIHALAFYCNQIDDPCMAMQIEALQALSDRLRELQELKKEWEI